MKAIKGLIITLIVIIALAGVTIIGGYIYVRSTYGIDLFRTAGQLKTLSQTPDESALCPNAFSASDMADVKSNMDEKASGLISYEEGKGYEGYTVDFSDVSSIAPFTGSIGFSSKQAGRARSDDFLRANRRKSENRRKGIARKTRSDRLFEYCGKR